METLHHFIAIVPMGGKYIGHYAQHSMDAVDMQHAEKIAKTRFSRRAVIVDMREHNNELCLPIPLAKDIYNNAVLKSAYKNSLGHGDISYSDADPGL